MAEKLHEIRSMKLQGTDEGRIEVAVIEEPYGEGSDPVASIGIFLRGANSEPDWKVHLPKENIDEVIAALREAKERL